MICSDISDDRRWPRHQVACRRLVERTDSLRYSKEYHNVRVTAALGVRKVSEHFNNKFPREISPEKFLEIWWWWRWWWWWWYLLPSSAVWHNCRRRQQENKEDDFFFFSYSVPVVYLGAFISLFLTPLLLLHRPDRGARSIVMSVSVCVSVCLSVHDHISRTTRAIFTDFLCMFSKSSHLYGNSHAMWDHTVLPATRQSWHSRLWSIAKAATRLSDPGGMRGWVDPVGWWHTEVVLLSSSSSSYIRLCRSSQTQLLQHTSIKRKQIQCITMVNDQT